MNYQKGDIVWVRFPFTGGSGKKARPALIISNDKVNATGDYILIQITSKIKNDGLSHEIKQADYLSIPLEIKSFITLHKIFIINESLILGRKTRIAEAFYKQVISQINKLFY